MVSVSVLVATCNRPRLFARSAAAILALRPPPREFLVMDQSDGPETREALLALDPGAVRVIYEHLAVKGKGRALNRALEVASGEFVALTDDDVVVEPGWLAAFQELHRQEPAVDAFCGRVSPEPGTDPDDYLNLVVEMEPRRLDRRTNPVHPSFCGADLVIRREALLRIGKYDIHFGPGGIFKSNDDGELAYRLTRGGCEVRYAPELVVNHLGWRKERENLALLHDYAFSLGGFVGYYARQGDLVPLAYFAWTCALELWRLVRAVASADGKRIHQRWVHVRGYGAGLARGLMTRARVAAT